ncbi:chemoreceptor glutamine deamidase/glutamate methylesterase CheD [Mesoaciditoga sp.]
MAGKIIIGIGEYAVASNPAILVTLGLGSCVGVCIRDKKKRVGGMIHVMLPETNATTGKLSKYAKPGIEIMVNEILKKGANLRDLEAKIAGGAAMFQSKGFDIGKRNVEKVKEVLLSLKIPLVAEDTGQNRARSIEFHLDTGELFIKKVGGKEKIELSKI